MIVGETGFDEYDFNGVHKVIAYAPVPDTTWFIGLNAPKTEFFSSITLLLYIIAGVTLLFAFAAGFINVRIIKRMVVLPIKKLVDISDRLVLGDVDIQIEHTSADEIGALSESYQTMIDSIKAQVVCVEMMADGDFSEIINAMTITTSPLNQIHASTKIEKLPVIENYLNKKSVLNNQSHQSEDQEIPGFFMSWDKSVTSDGIISLTAPIFWDILSKQQVFMTYKVFKRLFDILGSLLFISALMAWRSSFLVIGYPIFSPDRIWHASKPSRPCRGVGFTASPVIKTTGSVGCQ